MDTLGDERHFIDSVERALRLQLESVHLVGEIDLDAWGPRAEEALLTMASTNDPSQLRRRWPATFVTYIVYQGVMVYDEAFWRYVSIPELRSGQRVGPEFERALATLSLPVFDDIEELEGIKRESRGRYLRRIYLHGGMPAAAVPHVTGLLVSTLRAGAASASEVLDLWSGLDLQLALRSRPAARCLLYTGGFGERLIGQIIDLLRAANDGGDLAQVGAPSHLEEGVIAHLEQPPERTAWNFTPGPSVRIDPISGGPFLLVPAGYDVTWSVNGVQLGFSSRQVEQRFPLPLPTDGWTVVSDDGHESSARRFTAERSDRTVLVFDERGRLTRRGIDLGGITAYVLAESGTECSNTIDRRPVDGTWEGFELSTVDLRDGEALLVRTVDDGEVRKPVDNLFAPRIVRGPVDGVTSRGRPVLTGTITIGFDGYTPDPACVRVDLGGHEVVLDDVPRIYGEFDLTCWFESPTTRDVLITISRDDCDPVSFDVTYVPHMKLVRPAFVTADSPAPVELEITERNRSTTVERVVPPDENHTSLSIGLREGLREFEIQIDRLRWALEGPDTVAPMFGTERFTVHASELSRHRLLLQTSSSDVPVSLLDSDVDHVERPRSVHGRPGVKALPLGVFADTVKMSSASRHRLVLVQDGSSAPTIGMIETRYEPLAVKAKHRGGEPAVIEVSWDEISEWSDREVRLWNRSEDRLVCTQQVGTGERSATLVVDRLPADRYVVEVVVANAWKTPNAPGNDDVTASFVIESDYADVIRESIGKGRHADAEERRVLDSHIPVLAEMVVHYAPKRMNVKKRRNLVNRIVYKPDRLVDVVDEIIAQVGHTEQRGQLDHVQHALIRSIPVLWSDSRRPGLGSVPEDRMEHLWDVAPVAAASIDFMPDHDGRLDPACRQRWITATGCSIIAHKDPEADFDRLIALDVKNLPQHRLTGLLGRHAWEASLDELNGDDVDPRRWNRLQKHQAIVVEVRQRHPRVASHVVKERLYGHGGRSSWLADIVELSCEYVRPNWSRLKAEVEEAIFDLDRHFPIALRTGFIYAAATARMQQLAGKTAAK